MKKRSITIQYNAPVTLSFTLLSLLVLLLASVTHGWTTHHLFSVYRAPLTDLLTYPRFFLHVLGHIDYPTCAANLFLILVVGPSAEERFGSGRILLAIVITALVTSLVMWFLFPQSTLMGASGVVFMLIVLSSFAGARGGVIPLTLLLVLVLYLGTAIVQAFTGTHDLAQLTQIAGGVVGLVLGIVYARRGR